jgi:dTDP-4-amino-4,6-dideoxygalactose transaminase
LSKWRFPLSNPEIGDAEIAAVTKVLQSKWLSMGPETALLEAEFAQCFSKKIHAIAVANCTSALYLSCLDLNLQPGDEVILPALTYAATANVVALTGATPIFADCQNATDLTISLRDVKSKITSRTKAIIVVHFAGFACQMDEFVPLAERHNLALLEDCAHAPFAKHSGMEVGGFGYAGSFSFYSVKNMTCGEGGMLVTDNEERAQRLRLRRSHGVTNSAWQKFHGGERAVDVILPGLNCNLDDLRASLARVQLRRLPEFLEKRRQIVAWYRQELSDCQELILPFINHSLLAASPHLMTVLTESDCAPVREKLHNAGIETGRHYDLLTETTYYRDRTFTTSIPQLKNIFSLPLYPALEKSDVQFICQTLKLSL